MSCLWPCFAEEDMCVAPDEYYATVDASSANAALATASACHVWSFANVTVHAAKRLSLPWSDPARRLYGHQTFSKPTEFPMPDAHIIRPDTQLPVVRIVSAEESGTHSVGVLACTADGDFRYWENITYGLSPPEKFKSMRIYLGDLDAAQQLIPVEVQHRRSIARKHVKSG